MDEEVIEKYKRAGELAKKIRKKGLGRLEPGVNVFELVEELESDIKEEAEIAFPINLAVDDRAAHVTPRFEDKAVLEEGQVVKLDVGVDVDGYIADTAVTKEIRTNKHSDLIQASKNALNEVIKAIKEGERRLDKIGAIIQKEITEKGFSPIKNLSGHELKKYDLHAGVSIPNYETKWIKELENGTVVAIEPFATTGEGFVKHGKEGQIYMFKKEKSVRLGREIMKYVKKRKKLPFAKRWLLKKFKKAKVNIGLKKLTQANAIKRFPVLREKNKGLVSQKEHTIIIKDEPIVTTK